MGWFDGIASTISGALGGAASAISGAVSTASRAASSALSAAGSFVAPALSAVTSAASNVKIPSFSMPAGFQAPDLSTLTSAGISQVMESAASVQRVLNDPTKIAAQAAQTAGYDAARTAYEINKAYRIANGLPVVPFVAPTPISVAPVVKTVTEAIASIPAKVAAPVLSIMPTAETVKKQIEGAAAGAAKTANDTVKVATTAAAAIPEGITAPLSATMKAGAGTMQAVTQNPAPLANLSKSIPTYTPTATFTAPSIAAAPSGGNMIDQLVGTRDNAYTAGGETFAAGVKGNDAGATIAGAGIYGATTAVDMLAPIDALNVGNKIATGRIDQISGDEWLYGGIDVGLIALGALSGGTGYVAGKAAMKAGKVATAAAKATAVGKQITKGAEAAAPAGLAALGAAAGGNKAMIKIKKFAAPKVTKPKVTKTPAKAAAAKATSNTAAQKQAAANRAAQNQAIAQRNAAVKTRNAQIAEQNKAIKARNTAAQKKLAQKKAAQNTGPTSTPKTTAPGSVKGIETTKTAAKESTPSTVKALDAEKAGTKAAIEDAGTVKAATKSNLLPAAGIALAAGMTGIGLGSYLGGGSTLPADPNADPTDPDYPGGPGDAYPDGVPDNIPPEYLDPLTGEIDPAYWDYLNEEMDQIDAAEQAGTITPEQAAEARDQIAEQIDAAGGYFDPAFGDGTPYEAIEQAAQDATRAIPGDPLEWFRQNGLAAPAMAGTIIIVLYVVWWLYKRLVKGKHSTGHRRPRASGIASPTAGKQVVVM